MVSSFPFFSLYVIMEKTILELEKIFKETVEDISLGGYTSTTGKWIDFRGLLIDSFKGARFIKSISRQESEFDFSETKVYVQEIDSFQKAKEWADENCLVLNMASFYSAGGGVEVGQRAQEEELCRRSTLILSLYKYSSQKYSTFDIDAPTRFKYPIPEFGGIYSPSVVVYKSHNSYSPLDNPIKCSVVSVAAVKNPEINKKTGKLENKYAVVMAGKIRTILRIAVKYKHHKLVLGAFGCGAYHNPPEHVALIFKEVLEEKEFKGCFSEICFAIIMGDTNIKEFTKVFGKR